MLKRQLAAAVAGAILTSASSIAVASAAPVGCDSPNPVIIDCDITATDPPNPPPGGNDGNNADPASKPDCFDDLGGTEVPCTGPLGYWSNAHDCYLQVASTTPPDPANANDLEQALWGGHTDGAVYKCARPDDPLGVLIWLPQAPPGVINPAELAQQAVEAMQLRAITIGIAPEAGPDRMGYVGLPVYLWISQPAANTLGPITRTASAGAVTVTATAHVDHVTWSMGDGQTVRCAGARAKGTPYRAAYGGKPSPTCGYQYGQPGSWPISATSHWVITWAGGGATGTIERDLIANTQIRIGEIQVLVQ